MNQVIPKHPITGSTFQVVFRSGEKKYYDDVLLAAKNYFNEVWNVEGIYLPEFYKCDESGLPIYRIATQWVEIAQPIEIARRLDTIPGRKHGFEYDI